MGKQPDAREWSVDDVLVVQHCVLTAAWLFISNDRGVNQRRLSSAENLLKRFQDPGLDVRHPHQVPAALVAVGAFLKANEGNPVDRDWSHWALRYADIDPADVFDALDQIADMYARADDVPVQIFQPIPDCYQLVPLDELPYGVSMHNCGNQGFFDAQLAADYRRERRSKWLGRLILRKPEGGDPYRGVKWAGRAFDDALQAGDIQPCSTHSLDIDWHAINRVAPEFLAPIAPWTEAMVRAAAEARTDLNPPTRHMLAKLITDPSAGTPAHRWSPADNTVSAATAPPEPVTPSSPPDPAETCDLVVAFRKSGFGSTQGAGCMRSVGTPTSGIRFTLNLRH